MSVEAELADVQPQVDAARAAVGELKPANLNEIKGFRVVAVVAGIPLLIMIVLVVLHGSAASNL